MKKFLLILLSTFSLMAMELPQSIQTTVQSVSANGKHATLTNTIPKGRSGLVIHHYGNQLSAITHTMISQGSQQATIEPYTALDHNNLPTIKNRVQKGDKVIFGNFYSNLLLIAPNEQVYSQITDRIQGNWIHPDLYAMYLIIKKQDRISRENLKAFAQDNQVGLILIVTKERLLLLDPISQIILQEEPFTTPVTQTISPFYARFGQISNNFFGAESQQQFPEYYQGVGAIQ